MLLLEIKKESEFDSTRMNVNTYNNFFSFNKK